MSKRKERERMNAQTETETTEAMPDVIGELMGETLPPEAVEQAVEAIDVATDKTIIVPLGAIQNGYLSNHVEARLATDKQRRNMRRVLQGLRQRGEKLENGRFVDTQADAVKWLLEQLN
jgi:hypothetical protein